MMESKDLIDTGCLNAALYEEQYALYQKDPAAVNAEWRDLFDRLEAPTTGLRVPEKPQLVPSELEGKSVLYYPHVEIGGAPDELRVHDLIEAYRRWGHLSASVNPLASEPSADVSHLAIERSGFSKEDLPAYFPTCGLLPEDKAPLLEIINALKAIYCGKIGVEYMGLENPELEKWLQEQIEPNRFRTDFSIEQKRDILNHLNRSEIFESFLHTKYVGQKRFSLEGSETLIPMLAAVVDTSAKLGADEFVFGMAHRGRLNVLCNIFDKSYSDIFSEFEEGYIPAAVEGSGDVKYHKGFYSEVKTVHGHPVRLTLTPNPSHLESVDPVVEGQVRAKQIMVGDELKQERIIPILIHGDAAISGQGVVYETMQMARLNGYSTGGTIHFVINNQIGFTTLPRDGRSTRYCTDIAAIFGAPVFHVNAEDPEGCVYISHLASEMRHKFHCDVFIDLVGYRKYGHNESDEPAYTQPHVYQTIKKKQPIRDLYRDFLINHNVVEKQLAETLEAEFKEELQASQKAKPIGKKPDSEAAEIDQMRNKMEGLHPQIQTGVPLSILREIGQKLCYFPPDLAVHLKLVVLNKERLAMLRDDPEARPLDWGTAELLAYGSLLWNGTHVRLSGQDSCRGTFSHRHAVLMDQVKEEEYVPLQHLKAGQGRFDIYNSPLSEFAVLGFEFGYSAANLQALVLWEAQFGDFSNGAQVVIDQYIATTEQKWGQKSAITLLLPHGYEGQGPEHSSGRIERFLTLAGDHNIQVTNPTTPAQFFHLLRRQVLMPVKKPLIIFTPKGLLRHQACVSPLSDLAKGTFQEIIEDPAPPQRTRRLVLCSGRIYYDLLVEREKRGVEEMAIVRIEQLYPLDMERLREIIAHCVGLKECIWAQEEPSNMGAWSFIRPILREALPQDVELTYVGRTRSAASATGSHAMHKQEHAALLAALFGGSQRSIFDLAAQQRV